MSELLKQIIELLPTTTDVYYVDYRDQMPAKALGCIIDHNGEGDAFEEMDQLLWDWEVIPPKRAASKSRINTSPAFSAGRVSLLKPSYAFALE